MAVPQSDWSRGRNFFSTMPVTKVIVGLMAISFLAGILTRGAVNLYLVYVPFILPNMLTGLIGHPFAFGGQDDLINLLISGLMIYWFGGSLERSWGPRLYIAFLVTASAIAALVWTAGIFVFQQDPGTAVIAGPWLLVASVIVAWAWLNPEETILFWFVLPLKAKWIGWLDIVLLFFLFPSMHHVTGPVLFILGFFALGGVGVAYAFARYHRDWAWILRPQYRARPNRRVLHHPSSSVAGALLRPWREWQRRRRIAHLQRTLHIEEEDTGQSRW